MFDLDHGMMPSRCTLLLRIASVVLVISTHWVIEINIICMFVIF